jgi:hypothetical protein
LASRRFVVCHSCNSHLAGIQKAEDLKRDNYLSIILLSIYGKTNNGFYRFY